MHSQSSGLQELAGRVRHGDQIATVELRRELESSMVPMVRRVVRTGHESSDFSRKVLAEWKQLPRAEWHRRSDDEERLIRQVAQRICESVIERLRRSPSNRGIRETIRDW